MTGKRLSILILGLLLMGISTWGKQARRDVIVYGKVYLDWVGMKDTDSDFYNRVSGRLKLTLFNRQGDGWTLSCDLRNRYVLNQEGGNFLVIYNLNLSFDDLKVPWFVSAGFMNLYDSAGIGQLLGIRGGIRINRNVSMGTYLGLEPAFYDIEFQWDYQKYGVFLIYNGEGARHFSLSFNHLQYDGETERQYVYASLLYPIKKMMIIYGNLEYELGENVSDSDRLSRIFLNSRLDLGKRLDLIFHVSSGRGLDYHQFLLEKTRNPSFQNTEIDRYYYNQSYGARLGIKPFKNCRISIARRESEQKDMGIVNHSSIIGMSVLNILKTGISGYVSYHLNRGDRSESDFYSLSASRDFGRLTWNIGFSNFYNGVRFAADGSPEIFHLTDQTTISTDIFYILNRALALSLEYTYTDQESIGSHFFAVRMIYRRRS